MPLASPLTDNLQGWGTAAGAAIALLALIAAVLAYLGQRKQLRQQARELTALTVERQREADERRREQVSQVFVTWEPVADELAIKITNRSRYPVYAISIRLGNDADREMYIPHLLPGDSQQFYGHSIGHVGDLLNGDTVVSAELIDAAQRRWRITSQGRIDPIEA